MLLCSAKGVLKHIHVPSGGDRVLNETAGLRQLVPGFLHFKRATE